MSLSNFLQFNRFCPICQEPLGLYMQWVNSICFRASLSGDDEYQFDPFMGTNKDIATDDCFDHYMSLKDYGDSFNIEFSSNKLFGESKKYQVYFYYLCNPIGFKKKGSYGSDYEINLFKGCYYRSSPMMEFRLSEDPKLKKWDLVYMNEESKLLDNKDEAFSFKTSYKDLDKIYMLNLDYEEKRTTLFYYTATPEERVKKLFKAKIFEKDLPLLKTRPKLDWEDRESLLNRFDSWIIMS